MVRVEEGVIASSIQQHDQADRDDAVVLCEKKDWHRVYSTVFTLRKVDMEKDDFFDTYKRLCSRPAIDQIATLALDQRSRAGCKAPFTLELISSHLQGNTRRLRMYSSACSKANKNSRMRCKTTIILQL